MDQVFYMMLQLMLQLNLSFKLGTILVKTELLEEITLKSKFLKKYHLSVMKNNNMVRKLHVILRTCKMVNTFVHILVMKNAKLKSGLNLKMTKVEWFHLEAHHTKLVSIQKQKLLITQ